MICAPDGGIIDDLIVYRLGRGAVPGRRQRRATRAVVSDALAERLDGFRAVLDDRSLATGARRVQGPRSVEVLGAADRRRPRRRCATTRSPRARSPGSRRWSPGPATPARTASRSSSTRTATGELWDALLDGRRGRTGVPVGLGARDTLRLEAGMPLYGNELDLDDEPVRAGLGRVVKLDKPGDFVGRAALEKVAPPTARRARLVGLVVEGRGIARHGYPVHVGERRTGVVTSGTQSPTLGVPIAMAYVAPADAEPGTDGRRRDPRRAGPGAGRRRCRSTSARLTAGRLTSERRSPSMVPDRPALHQGPRVGPRRGRRGDHRHHRSTPPTSSATSSSSSCPTPGAALEQFATFGVVESVKAVSDLFAPVGGEVIGDQRRAGRHARSWSTATRTARAGCSGSGSPTRPSSTTCSTPTAYDALIAAG